MDLRYNCCEKPYNLSEHSQLDYDDLLLIASTTTNGFTLHNFTQKA